jgi:hypothetical protein
MEAHIIDSLYLAPFSLKYRDMTPDSEHIKEKYDVYVGILLNFYT